jgi:hypothetical protein
VVVANILDSDTGQEPSRRLLQAGMGIGVDDGMRWDLHSQFQNLSQNLELKFSLPWRSKDELPIIPAVPVVEHLDPEVDKKVIDFLKSEIPVQATTVKVDLAVEVLPLG